MKSCKQFIKDKIASVGGLVIALLLLIGGIYDWKCVQISMTLSAVASTSLISSLIYEFLRDKNQDMMLARTSAPLKRIAKVVSMCIGIPIIYLALLYGADVGLKCKSMLIVSILIANWIAESSVDYL